MMQNRYEQSGNQVIVIRPIKEGNMDREEYIDTSKTIEEKASSDLEVLNIGHQYCQPGYGYGPTTRRYNVIHFVLSGEGFLDVSGSRSSVHPGDVFIIPAGQVLYYEASRTVPWHYAWISLLGAQAGSVISGLMSCSEKHYLLRNLPVEKYGNLLLHMSRLQSGRGSSYFEAESALYKVLAMLTRDLGIQLSASSQMTTADQIRFYMDYKYAELSSIREIADHFGIHPNHLTRLFRTAFGTTPKQYLENMKMQSARRLLQTTDLPVSWIARSMGCDDPLAFSKAFRKQCGLSPTAYRIEKRTGEQTKT